MNFPSKLALIVEKIGGQTALSERLGVSRETIRKWGMSRPKENAIRGIASAFSLEPDVLLNDSRDITDENLDLIAKVRAERAKKSEEAKQKAKEAREAKEREAEIRVRFTMEGVRANYEIIQSVEGGTLVQSLDFGSWIEPKAHAPEKLALGRGEVIFIKWIKGVQGARYSACLFESETYSYTTTLGAKKTVRAFMIIDDPTKK